MLTVGIDVGSITTKVAAVKDGSVTPGLLRDLEDLWFSEAPFPAGYLAQAYVLRNQPGKIARLREEARKRNLWTEEDEERFG